MLSVQLVSLLIILVGQVWTSDPCLRTDGVLYEEELNSSLIECCFERGLTNLTETFVKSAYDESEKRVKAGLNHTLRLSDCGLSSDLTVKSILDALEIQNVTKSLILTCVGPIEAKHFVGTTDQVNYIDFAYLNMNVSLDAFVTLPQLKRLDILCDMIEHVTPSNTFSHLEHLELRPFQYLAEESSKSLTVTRTVK